MAKQSKRRKQGKAASGKRPESPAGSQEGVSPKPQAKPGKSSKPKGRTNARKSSSKPKPVQPKEDIFHLLEKPALAYLITGILAFAVFAQTIGYPFLYDDVRYVENNPTIQRVSNLPSAFTSAFPPQLEHLGQYRPLFAVTLTLDYLIAAPKGTRRAGFMGQHVDETPFHITNVTFHVLASLAAVWLTFQFFRHDPGLMPLLVGGLFATHPVHVEAVANISGRAEVQMAFFFLLACGFFWRHQPGIPLAKAYNLWASVGCFAASIFTKESGVTFLPVIVGLMWMRPASEQHEDVHPANLSATTPGKSVNDIPWKVRLACLLPFLAMTLLFINGRLWFTQTIGTPRFNDFFAVFHELAIAPSVAFICFLYHQLLLLPTHFYPDYEFPLYLFHAIRIDPITGWGNIFSIIGLLLFLGWSGLLIYGMIKRRPWCLSLGFLFATLSIYSHLIRIGDLAAERFLYLPSFGAFLMVAWWLNRWKNRVVMLSIYVGIIIFLSVMTIRQNQTWSSVEAFFDHMVKGNPASGEGYYGLAQEIGQQLNAQLIQASQALESSDPEKRQRAKQLKDEAKHGFQQVLELYEQCLEVEPGHLKARIGIMNIALALEPPQPELIREQYRVISAEYFSRLEDPFPVWGTMGRVALRDGDHARALRFFQAAKRQMFNESPQVQQEVNTDMARCLAVLSREILKDRDAARSLRYARKAVALSPLPTHRASLANILTATANFNEARTIWQELIREFPQDGRYQEGLQQTLKMEAVFKQRYENIQSDN
jgi:tetratricopeptide (TPR) repeat protein